MLENNLKRKSQKQPEIYGAVIGSRCYNLQNQNSDLDCAFVVFQTPKEYFCGIKPDYKIPLPKGYDAKIMTFVEFVESLKKQKSLIPFEVLFSYHTIKVAPSAFMELFIDYRDDLFGRKFIEHLVRSAQQIAKIQESKPIGEALKRLAIADILLSGWDMRATILLESDEERIKNVRNENYFNTNKNKIISHFNQYLDQMDGLLAGLEDDSNKINRLINQIVGEIYDEYR